MGPHWLQWLRHPMGPHWFQWLRHPMGPHWLQWLRHPMGPHWLQWLRHPMGPHWLQWRRRGSDSNVASHGVSLLAGCERRSGAGAAWLRQPRVDTHVLEEGEAGVAVGVRLRHPRREGLLINRDAAHGREHRTE